MKLNKEQANRNKNTIGSFQKTKTACILLVPKIRLCNKNFVCRGYQKSFCQKKQAWTWHKHEEYCENAVWNCARTFCAFVCRIALINDYIETMRVVPHILKRISKKLYDENANKKKIIYKIFMVMLQKTVRIKKQKKVYNRHKKSDVFKSFAKTAAL